MDKHQEHKGHVPVEDRIAEGANAARATEEQVPDLVRETFRLRVRREAHLARRAAQGKRDDLARGLTRLDILREEGAVR